MSLLSLLGADVAQQVPCVSSCYTGRIRRITPHAVEIPKQSLFKVAEVCEIAKVQAYVLRSWETEFSDLGVTKTAGQQRVYRRTDVERVLRIKHLLFVEGLTLGAARRQLDEERGTDAVAGGASGVSAVSIEELFARDARERLAEVKKGLRSILEMLSANGGGASDRPVEGPAIEASTSAAATKPHLRGGGSESGRSRVAKRKRRST